MSVSGIAGMRTFLVETYTPVQASLARIETRVRLAVSELASAGEGVRYVRFIFVPEDETCFHWFEARSADTVRAAAERAELGAVRIVEARISSGRSEIRDRPRSDAGSSTRIAKPR